MSRDSLFSDFGDEEKTTVWRPVPDGFSPSEAGAEPQRASPAPEEFDSDGVRSAVFADNPVVAAALSLLALVSPLAHTASHSDIEGLRRKLAEEIRTFETAILRRGISQEQARMATYVLCALLDETIQHTPWGKDQNRWGQRSLSIIFHKEAWGGKKFFPITDHLCRLPEQNLQLIELCYLCLSLGFQGEYRIKANGLSELEKYRTELYLLIQRIRGDFERSLSPRWQGLPDVRGKLSRAIPFWVIPAVAGAILLLAYLGFLFSISDLSGEIGYRLAALGNEKIHTAAPLPTPLPAPAVPNREQRLIASLEPYEKRNWVAVVNDRKVRIDYYFPTGRAEVSPEDEPDFMAMLSKLVEELRPTRNWVTVVGHTDNQPVRRSARFPDNWTLSRARAEYVARILESNGLAGRVSFQGKADYEPAAPNDSEDNRRKNRRVEVLIQ